MPILFSNMETKKCIGPCGLEKHVADFSWQNKSRNKRHPRCKVCHSEADAARYLANRPELLEMAKKKFRQNREYNERKLIEYLESHPCIDCGEADILVLEFDHKPDQQKSGSVCALAKNASWLTVEAEIKKCDVRCANCHRRKTNQQLGWYRSKHVNGKML